jgi:hypothetical protein
MPAHASLPAAKARYVTENGPGIAVALGVSAAGACAILRAALAWNGAGFGDPGSGTCRLNEAVRRFLVITPPCYPEAAVCEVLRATGFRDIADDDSTQWSETRA